MCVLRTNNHRKLLQIIFELSVSEESWQVKMAVNVLRAWSISFKHSFVLVTTVLAAMYSKENCS